MEINKHLNFWKDVIKDRKNKKYLGFFRYWYYATRLYFFRSPVNVVHISRFARELFCRQYKNLIIVENKTFPKWGLLLAGAKLQKNKIEYSKWKEVGL